MNLSEWWEALSTLQKIYWGLAIPSSILLIILLISTLIGADSDLDLDDADGDIESDGGMGFQFFSLKNIIGFFTIFSWMGIACLDSGMSNKYSIAASIVAGLLMMLVMASIFYFMGKLSDSGTLSLKNAIGKTGDVYLTIPAKRGGFGKVNINVQGSYRELKGLSDDDEDLTQGTIVKVLEVIDENILLVQKSK